MFENNPQLRKQIGDNAFFIGIGAAGSVLLFGVFQGAPVTSPLMIGACVAGLAAIFIAEYIACSSDSNPAACVFGQLGSAVGEGTGEAIGGAGQGFFGSIFGFFGSLFKK